MPCYHRLKLVRGYLSGAFHTEMHNRGSALRCLHPEDDELLVLFEYSVARVFPNLIDFYAYHPQVAPLSDGASRKYAIVLRDQCAWLSNQPLIIWIHAALQKVSIRCALYVMHRSVSYLYVTTL